MDWRKSTYSVANGGACVETASDNSKGLLLVRDTTNRNGGMLTFTASAWQAFTAAIK